jgi:hypothetical protein
MHTIRRRKNEKEFLPAFRIATINNNAFDPTLEPARFK